VILTGNKKLVTMMNTPLESPRQGGSNGGQIIKIDFFINWIVKNESIVSIAT
jgi:hypothetical protein